MVLAATLLLQPSSQNWPWAFWSVPSRHPGQRGLSCSAWGSSPLTVLDPTPPDYDPTPLPWLAMLPRWLVWAMALLSEPLFVWFAQVGLWNIAWDHTANADHILQAPDPGLILHPCAKSGAPAMPET